MISVIIPAHNDAAYIEVAINSIQNQTLRNIEILVVDDFSHDNTEDIVKKIAQDDQRVRYLRNTFQDSRRINRHGVNINAGYSARNYGLQHARGEWITFQDADDLSLLNRLEIQLQLATKFDVSHLTTSCVWLEEKYIGKKLNMEKFLNDFSMEDSVATSEELFKLAQSNLGAIGNWPDSIFKRIPFALKRTRWVRKLFFPEQDCYPGTAGAPFF